jgi:hypothetical protein
MKFLIRDDDCCAFTTVEDIERCYARIWDIAPANLSVTPFRIPGDDPHIPAGLIGDTRVMPLGAHGELVHFLREKIAAGKIDVALHGYHHTRPRGRPEYAAGDDLDSRTRDGKRYLEDLLQCEVQTFVPPYNTIDAKGFDAIVGAHLNLVGIPSFWRNSERPFSVANISRLATRKFYRSVRGIDYPHVLRFSDHKEVGYVSLTPAQTLSAIRHQFEGIAAANGVFVLAVHYHAFDKPLKSGERIGDVVTMLVEQAAKLPDTRFCSYRQLWSEA